MLKILIFLIIFIAAGIGGLQFYISHKVDKFLGQAGNYAQLMGGELTFQKVSTTYDGAIEISSVNLGFPAPKGGGNINITTDLVRAKLPSLLDIIQLSYRNLKQLPASAQLQFEGMRMPSSQLDLLNSQLTPDAGNTYPFYMTATEMGLDEIKTDFSMGYLHDEFMSGLDFDINYDINGLGSYSINLKIKNISTLKTTALIMQDPQLQLMTINYNDESYNKLWLKRCQDKNKISADQCIINEIEKFNIKLARNYKLKFSDKFVTNISDYMKNSGDFKISIDLSEGSQSLMKVMQMGEDPLELLVYQNVILSINGEYIQPIFNQLAEDEITSITESIDQPSRPEKKQKTEKIILKTYQDFKQYIGKKVLILTDKRKKYIGIVLDAQPDKVKVKVNLPKGDTFSYRLAYDRISYAEVYKEERLY